MSTERELRDKLRELLGFWSGLYPDGSVVGERADEILALLATARQADAERIRALETDIAFMRDDWSPFGIRACRLCVYENGLFIRRCKVHEWADQQGARAEQAEALVSRMREALQAQVDSCGNCTCAACRLALAALASPVTPAASGHQGTEA